MHMQHRSNEPKDLAPLPRSSRFVINDDGYYYRTRECELIGPFSTESQALFDLNVFIKVTEIEQTLVFNY